MGYFFRMVFWSVYCGAKYRYAHINLGTQLPFIMVSSSDRLTQDLNVH